MDVAIHSFDPADRNEVVLTVRTVFLRQFNGAAFGVIDDTDLLAAGRDSGVPLRSSTSMTRDIGIRN